MNQSEVGMILAMAASIDPRLKPASTEDAGLRIRGWQEVLDPEMPLEAARTALTAHYAQQSRVIMPADLNTAWKAQKARDIDFRRAAEVRNAMIEAEQSAVPMPAHVRNWRHP